MSDVDMDSATESGGSKTECHSDTESERKAAFEALRNTLPAFRGRTTSVSEAEILLQAVIRLEDLDEKLSKNEGEASQTREEEGDLEEKQNLPLKLSDENEGEEIMAPATQLKPEEEEDDIQPLKKTKSS